MPNDRSSDRVTGTKNITYAFADFEKKYQAIQQIRCVLTKRNKTFGRCFRYFREKTLKRTRLIRIYRFSDFRIFRQPELED